MSKLFVVGIGPGSIEYMTNEAVKALNIADVICGYSVYVDLVKPYFEGKEYLSTAMTKESVRCQMALDIAESGRNVALVCSGDCGVYGMAGLVMELNKNNVEIEIISGVTAAISGGAVLGSPLTNDFAVISLSDLLTPIEKIKKRLECAAMGDFCIALYNPSSKKRADYINWASEIMLKFKPDTTICGWVKNIGREGQYYELTTLGELKNAPLDMFCTVFIGNADTVVINGKMVTKRGYKEV